MAYNCMWPIKNLCHLSAKVFTAQRYTSTVYAVVVCPSVCMSVCLSVFRKPALPKWLNVESRKQLHTTAHGLQFSDAKDIREIP